MGESIDLLLHLRFLIQFQFSFRSNSAWMDQQKFSLSMSQSRVSHKEIFQPTPHFIGLSKDMTQFPVNREFKYLDLAPKVVFWLFRNLRRVMQDSTLVSFRIIMEEMFPKVLISLSMVMTRVVRIKSECFRQRRSVYAEGICMQMFISHLTCLHFVFLLSFIVPPRIANFTFNGPKEPGELAQVACMVSQGDMPLQSFSWTFQGHEDALNQQKGVEISKFGPTTSILTIQSVDLHHSGTYNCFVSNRAGNASHSAQLIVLGNL